MTSSGYNLPFTEFENVDLAEADSKSVFWKQLLPMNGRINYKGENIVFDRTMLNELAKSYSDKAYDMVPFQLANDDNKHPVEDPQNMDPRRTHGELSRLKVDNKGLWGQFSLNDEAVKVLKNTNNKLGVSVSMKRGYQRADGRFFPYALRHVLGTLDGKVTGMSPWSTVEMSNADENEEVADLSGEKIDTTTNGNKDGGPTETVTVPKAEWDDVMAYIQAQKQADNEFEAMMAGKGEESEEEKIEASNTTDPNIVNMSNELASQRFERYADGLVRQGVPPSMIDHARKVLGKSDMVDLSNDGGEDDPRTVIRAILEQAKGTIDLSETLTHRQGGESDDPFESQTFKDMQVFFGVGEVK